MLLDDNVMLLFVDHGGGLMRFFTPEKKHHILAFLVDLLDGFFRKSLPTFLLVTITFASAHSQHRVQ